MSYSKTHPVSLQDNRGVTANNRPGVLNTLRSCRFADSTVRPCPQTRPVALQDNRAKTASNRPNGQNAQPFRPFSGIHHLVWPNKTHPVSLRDNRGEPLHLQASPRQHRAERPAAEQMHVQMIDLLPGVAVTIDQQTVAPFVDALLLRKFRRH